MRYKYRTARCSHGFAVGLVECQECKLLKRNRLAPTADQLAGADVIQTNQGNELRITLRCPGCNGKGWGWRADILALHEAGGLWYCSSCREEMKDEAKAS